MKPLVVDASVAAKWFLPEEGAAQACRLLNGRRPLVAPDLIQTELANILWKLHRTASLTAEEARQILSQFRTMPLSLTPSPTLLPAALEIAMLTKRTVYDSLYLALAVELETVVITDDRRWGNSLRNTPFDPFLKALKPQQA